MENLDQAIEKALAVEVDYNFAIDKDDNIYMGRSNKDKPEEILNNTDYRNLHITRPVSN